MCQTELTMTDIENQFKNNAVTIIQNLYGVFQNKQTLFVIITLVRYIIVLKYP